MLVSEFKTGNDLERPLKIKQKVMTKLTTIVELTETNMQERPNWDKIFTDSELTGRGPKDLLLLKVGNTTKNRYFKAVLAFSKQNF